MMKKYLMTGMAAIAFCAAFTSCSSDHELFNQDAIQKKEAAQIVEKYNQAFLQYVGGSIAADQTWGFGGYSAAKTRAAVNVNGNMWEEMPNVTVEEKNLVFAHVNKDKSQVVGATETYPYNLEDYWVTQVWTGTDTYTNTDGQSGILGSSKMNNLQIAEDIEASINESGELVGKWYHVNNFNRGDNTDWSGNTLVSESGTCDFAYHNSEDSKYHNKWIAVPGSAIDESLSDYYYICFDFEASLATTYTNVWFKIPGINPGEWVEKNGVLRGSWEDVEEAKKAGATVTIEMYIDGEMQNVTYTVGQEGTSEWRLGNVVGGNMEIKADNVYTDWIIRLVKAEPADEEIIVDTDPDNVCIIAEDLSASEAGDFDFNDVVFTVNYTSETTANVTIYAAGGTLPLTVAGHEVHAELGYANADANGLYKMINTGAKADVNGVGTATFSVSGIDKSKRGNDIAILVNKGKKNENGEFVDNWIELTATKGNPAAKLCVGVEFATSGKWCDERESIKTKYPTFAQWVAENPAQIWWY